MTSDSAATLELAAKIGLPALGALLAGARWSWPYVKRAHTSATRFVAVMQAAAADVTVIKKELYPNGGSSMRDTVDATRNDLRWMRFDVALLRSVQRSLLNDQTGVGRFECDPYGQCVWVSTQWTQWTGLASGQATGHGWAEAIHHEDRERVFDAWATAIRDRRAFAARLRYTHVPQGTVTPVYVEARPIEADSGEVVAWFGTARLLTEVA